MASAASSRYQFLVETYRTERLKTLSVWSQVPDERLRFRPEPRARSPLEHMVHQCVSEDTWMRTMLGIEVSRPALPSAETRLAFMEHYADVSRERLGLLAGKPDEWFEAETDFFDTRRTRAWVVTRRIAHSAHHRGQLTVYLRLFGQAVYSTYGPTADTGGLFQNHAPTVYRYDSLEDLLEKESHGGEWRTLPGPGQKPPTERPD